MIFNPKHLDSLHLENANDLLVYCMIAFSDNIFTIMNGTIHIFSPTYQSRDISFSNWISLFTLCLTPLVIHLTSGAPSASYLVNNRPRWHDRICHYNPISIMWWYLAIVDRCIRAIEWNAIDMATSNAYSGLREVGMGRKTW